MQLGDKAPSENRNKTPSAKQGSQINENVMYKDPYSFKIADKIQRGLEKTEYRSKKMNEARNDKLQIINSMLKTQPSPKMAGTFQSGLSQQVQKGGETLESQA